MSTSGIISKLSQNFTFEENNCLVLRYSFNIFVNSAGLFTTVVQTLYARWRHWILIKKFKGAPSCEPMISWFSFCCKNYGFFAVLRQKIAKHFAWKNDLTHKMVQCGCAKTSKNGVCFSFFAIREPKYPIQTPETTAAPPNLSKRWAQKLSL